MNDDHEQDDDVEVEAEPVAAAADHSVMADAAAPQFVHGVVRPRARRPR